MNLKIGRDRERLYQWDTGQILVVEDEGLCRQVHYCRLEDESALVCPIREEEGLRVADVPNILLQKAGAFRAYLYDLGEDGTETRFVKSFTVTARPKPEDYVYTETEVMQYQKLEERIRALEQTPADPGIKSWDEIADKPFGVIGNGDTLEWDGNRHLPKTIIQSGYPGSEEYDTGCVFYKVSDAIITAEDLANGAITKLWYADSNEIGVKECNFANGGIVQKEDGAIWIIAEDAWGNQMCGFELYCYPENSTYPAGIYFGADIGISRVIELTIPGYGKFPVTKTVAMDVMPEPLRFGEREGFSNTLVWDGDTATLEPHPDPNEQGWYILSDVVLTAEDRANGIFIECPGPGTSQVITGGINSGIFTVDDSDPENITFITWDENGNDVPFMRFTPHGVLVVNWWTTYTDWETMESIPYYIRLHSLTIPGFNKFPVSVNKTIDKKYLPKAAGVWNCYSEYVSAQEFNELLKSLRDAGYLGKVN